jgi:hypothetical protein
VMGRDGNARIGRDCTRIGFGCALPAQGWPGARRSRWRLARRPNRGGVCGSGTEHCSMVHRPLDVHGRDFLFRRLLLCQPTITLVTNAVSSSSSSSP